MGDAGAIPVAPETYDAVFDFGIIHHVPDWRRTLVEIHRVLKPNGRLVLVDIDYPHNKNWLGTQTTRLWASLGDIIRDMDALFKQTGFQFTDDEVGGFGSIHLYIATKKRFPSP